MCDLLPPHAGARAPRRQARVVSVLGTQLRWGDEMAVDELGRSLMSDLGELGPTHLNLLVRRACVVPACLSAAPHCHL